MFLVFALSTRSDRVEDHQEVQVVPVAFVVEVVLVVLPQVPGTEQPFRAGEVALLDPVSTQVGRLRMVGVVDEVVDGVPDGLRKLGGLTSIVGRHEPLPDGIDGTVGHATVRVQATDPAVTVEVDKVLRGLHVRGTGVPVVARHKQFPLAEDVVLVFSMAEAIHKIFKFVSDVRSARKDMDQVACQLMSLQLCLESLSGDTYKRTIDLPSEVRSQIKQTLLACEANVEQILQTLLKAQPGRLGRRVQWTFSNSDDVYKIRSALESNKMALEIGLSIGTISLLTRSMKKADGQSHSVDLIVRQAEAISISTARIKNKLEDLTVLHKDTTRLDAINVELVALRTRLGILSTNTQKSQSMKLFVDQARINSVESPLRVVPIPLSPSANADSSLKVPSESQEASSAELCPICANALTESKQRDVLEATRDRELAYAKRLEQNRNKVQALEQEVVSLQQDKRGLEQDFSDFQRSITQKSSVALSAREAKISELVLDLDQYRQGENEPWSIDPDDKSHFDSIFDSVETDSQGFITHEQAMQLFNEWIVPKDVCQKILKLADINSTGVLNRDEFAMAVYLVRQQQKSEEHDPPDVLPFRLVPPSMRKQRQLDQLVVHSGSNKTANFSIYVAESSAIETERDRINALKQRLQAHHEQLQVERAKREALESKLSAMQPLQGGPASPTPPVKNEHTGEEESQVPLFQLTTTMTMPYSEIQRTVARTIDYLNERSGQKQGYDCQRQMKQIAVQTHDPPVCYDILLVSYKHLTSKSANWKTVLKILIIFEFLLLNGSYLCCMWAKKNIKVIETFVGHIHIDRYNGTDLGKNVRVAAEELVALIGDEERLKARRQEQLILQVRSATSWSA